MQLRNLTIPYAQPAVFAPMAGFTDAACRHLMADHGAAWTVSEMASAKAITFGDDKSVRLLRDKASHGIYAVQLFGAEPETMAQAIRIIQEKGVQFDILEAENGVGVAPILGCQQLDTEVSPVHQTVAIQNQQFHTGTSEKTKHIDRNNKNSISQIALVWGVW